MPAEIVRTGEVFETWEWVCLECEAESARFWHIGQPHLAQADADEHNNEENHMSEDDKGRPTSVRLDEIVVDETKKAEVSDKLDDVIGKLENDLLVGTHEKRLHEELRKGPVSPNAGKLVHITWGECRVRSALSAGDLKLAPATYCGEDPAVGEYVSPYYDFGTCEDCIIKFLMSAAYQDAKRMSHLRTQAGEASPGFRERMRRQVKVIKRDPPAEE